MNRRHVTSVLQDGIYNIIMNQLIAKSGDTQSTNPTPTTNPLLSPIQNALFEKEEYRINADTTSAKESVITTSALDATRLDDSTVWSRLRRQVSPEEYIARTLIYATTKKHIPIFSSANEFRIKTVIATLTNPIIPKNVLEKFIFIYAKFQRTYQALNHFARMWRIRRTPVRIQTDLYMTELDPNSPNNYTLVNENGIYYFSLNNLTRIIVDAITHQQGMFAEPLIAKNPYTNEPIKKVDLFNIYLCAKEQHLKISPFFEKFFNCEFNVYEFRRRHETELRENSIRQYVKTTSISELYHDVNDMLSDHRMSKLIKPDKEYPKQKFVEIMRPFLELYFLEKYSFSSMTRSYSSKKLKTMLRRFVVNNPMYGRRIVVGSGPSAAIFASLPPKRFHEKAKYQEEYCKTYYMSSHIYDECIFDRYLEDGDAFESYYTSPSETEDEDYERSIPPPLPMQPTVQHNRTQAISPALLLRAIQNTTGTVAIAITATVESEATASAITQSEVDSEDEDDLTVVQNSTSSSEDEYEDHDHDQEEDQEEDEEYDEEENDSIS